MRSGNLFVISGPSGAGKGTLVARLLQEVPDAWLSVSATTRSPRSEEVDGLNYYFLTYDQFMSILNEDGFLEWAKYANNYYGTPLKSVSEHMNKGFQVILEIDVQGALQVRNHVPNAKLIFVEPPSFEELNRRLHERGTEDEENIKRRLDAAKVELSKKEVYDIRLVNDDLEVAVGELVAYVNKQAEEI